MTASGNRCARNGGWMRMFWPAIAFALTTAPVAPPALAQALTSKQLQTAQAITMSMFAGEKCPGLHLAKDAILANSHDAGATPQQVQSEEWKYMIGLAHKTANELYAEDPALFCARMWEYYGVGHGGIKYPLLTRD